MPRPRGSTDPKGFLRSWIDEWPKIAATLTVSFILFMVATASDGVRKRIWPTAPTYPVICTAEPVWLGGNKRLVEIYLVNTSRDSLTEEKLKATLHDALGRDAGNASPTVFFPYLPNQPRATSAVPDDKFNNGKGALVASVEANGVRIEPELLKPRAILRVNVMFAVEDDDVPFSRGAKGSNGIFDLDVPEGACFAR